MADLDVVHEDAQVLAYHHTRPFWPTHVVVVPKRHIGSLTTVTEADEADVRALLAVVQRVAREVETSEGAAGGAHQPRPLPGLQAPARARLLGRAAALAVLTTEVGDGGRVEVT